MKLVSRSPQRILIQKSAITSTLTYLCDIRRVLKFLASRLFLFAAILNVTLVFHMTSKCAHAVAKTCFTLCPLCRAEVCPKVFHTASREIVEHPNSTVSKFYNGLRVLCSNLRCNRYTHIIN